MTAKLSTTIVITQKYNIGLDISTTDFHLKQTYKAWQTSRNEIKRLCKNKTLFPNWLFKKEDRVQTRGIDNLGNK